MTYRSFCLAFLAALVTAAPSWAEGQAYQPRTARRHFISVSYDWLYTYPSGFAAHPLSDLLGRPVSEAHLQSFDYQTMDQQTRVHVLNFRRRGQGASLTLYPLGLSRGTTLMVRGSVQDMPDVRLAFDGRAPAANYELTNARAYDLGAGFVTGDLSPGWGLGSHAFLIGGAGRATSDLGRGRRYFGEVGGGVGSGPFGVEVSIKYASTEFSAPSTHRLVTLPVTVRATLTF